MISTDYTRRLEQLVEICGHLNVDQELEPQLQHMIKIGAELTDSESSSILLYHRETHALHFVAGDEIQLESLKSVYVPLERSIAGEVFRTDRVAISTRGESDDRIYRVVDRELCNGTRSLLAIPMKFRGQTIGVMEAINKSGQQDYNEQDIKFLETIAVQAAMAIQYHELKQGAQKVVEQAQELEQLKSDFMAIASHELRTPVGVILGQVTILQDVLKNGHRKDLNIIEESALKLRTMIEKLSDFDHLDRSSGLRQHQEIPITAFIREGVKPFYKIAREQQISLSVETGDDDWIVDGDRELLRTALANLIQNGLDFTDACGKLLITVEGQAEQVRISVIDNGIGIPLDEQEKIFDRFYQVEKHLTRHHGGMGLGLAETRDIVAQHGGQIWVDSVEGMGSQFCILLPARMVETLRITPG